MKNRISEPDLADVIDGAIEDFSYSINCHRIGVIESFNPTNQTATVKMIDKGVNLTQEGEMLVDFALLVDCPVVIYRGANGGLTVPINKGDTCLIIFNDRDMDNWLVDGLSQRPNTLRNHDFSDAIILVGVRNQINKIVNYNNNATELNYLSNKIAIDAKISLLNSSGGSIVLDDKLELKNTAENLKGIIEDLITIITNLKTVDPISGNLPIDGGTASSLSSLNSRVGSLLK